MADSNRIIASFSTDNLRPIVIVDGVQYECRQRDDFGLREFVRLQSLKSKVYEKMMIDDEELTEADVGDIERLLGEFVRLVLIDCPDAVHDKLADVQKLKIVELFNSELARTIPQTPAPNRAALRAAMPDLRKELNQTSTSSSRRSSGSTGRRRNTGSTRSP